MKFSFCFCLKRDRATYNISSENIYYANSKLKPPTVILPPIPLSSNVEMIPIESDYAKINDLSGDGEISIVNIDRTSTRPIEHSNPGKLTPIRPQRQSFDDNSELYATVNRKRTTKDEQRIKTNATSTNDASSRQDLSSSSIIDTSPTLYSTRFSMHTQHPPLNPPPLPPFPPQVYTSVATNHHRQISHGRPYYDDIIVCKSSQDHDQSLQTEDQRSRSEQPLHETYYSSVNSEQDTGNGSDIYAEIANSSSSDVVYPNSQCHYYSRPSNDAGAGDDSSESYATVLEL
ncbi:unnamed protein product [Rotaria socialis]|uniref:Uncharacterized protein n=2 Tax=Rotaria socialis TaxID=392032 RepID=A0A817TUI8_9BILA|nr:unnamed protein product [Rotaria socialis]CAF3336089.1 unnamed protein product [Rotaria socialis]CAF3345422.1 unnamed protein product [Rotaria socialis]CAF3375679.1 unnamed protein product [Rotaria socialis]CAF3461427.1 unnamed protein product [Rotaria socialis]